jgi:hypothetical protein
MLAWALAVTTATSSPADPAAPPGPALPTVIKAEPAADWNSKFAGKEGWIGGDEAYSVESGPRRVLWLFGDSLLGAVLDGKRPGAVMVNNTVAVQDSRTKDAAIRFVAGKGKDGKPAAIFHPPDGKGWFWPQAAIRVGDQLFVFLVQIEKTTNPGVFGFRPIGQWLAVVENPEDDPEAWKVKQRPVPFAEFSPNGERSWGSAVLADAGHLYVYGYEARGKGIGKRRLTVARVAAERLNDFEAWRFFTSKGWSERQADAAPLAGGLATEFSVSRVPGGKGYVAVCTENGLGERIVGRFADAPEGPWSDPVLLYQCPEMGKDKGVFCYAAKAHPWAVNGSELLVSYCVNTWEFARLFRDEVVYRPKFVRVELGPPKEKP